MQKCIKLLGHGACGELGDVVSGILSHAVTRCGDMTHLFAPPPPPRLKFGAVSPEADRLIQSSAPSGSEASRAQTGPVRELKSKRDTIMTRGRSFPRENLTSFGARTKHRPTGWRKNRIVHSLQFGAAAVGGMPKPFCRTNIAVFAVIALCSLR